MTTKAQKDLGIMSNMSDERLMKLFGVKSLKKIPKIESSGFGDRLKVKKKTKKKKSRKA